MFIHTNQVKLAVNTIGGPTKTSNLVGVSNGAVHAWIKAQRIANIDYAKKVAAAAGMQVNDLRGLS